MATATERTTVWRWAPRLIGLATVVLAVLAVATYIPVRALVNGEAVRDRGIVLERRSGIPRYREHLVVEYQRAGRQHRVTIPVWADHDSDAQPGRGTLILVDPDDPTVVSTDGWLPAYHQWSVATVVGLALYLCLLVARQGAERPVGHRARQAVLERDRRRAEPAAEPPAPEAGET